MDVTRIINSADPDVLAGLLRSIYDHTNDWSCFELDDLRGEPEYVAVYAASYDHSARQGYREPGDPQRYDPDHGICHMEVLSYLQHCAEGRAAASDPSAWNAAECQVIQDFVLAYFDGIKGMADVGGWHNVRAGRKGPKLPWQEFCQTDDAERELLVAIGCDHIVD